MKIYLDTVGCRLNQAEIEHMANQLRAAGHNITSDPAEAESAILNTCSVTSQAASDSRQKIRQMAKAGIQNITVTGCWSALAPQQALTLPGVQRVIPNEEKDHLVPTLLGLPPEIFDSEPLTRLPLPGLRQRARAFIKVQDGCDNACTFCITTAARGANRSRPLPAVLADVRGALQGGAQEIVLTGVHLGAWGQEKDSTLKSLVKSILEETETPRLRLSSLEPWDLDEDFFSLWQNPRLMPHLHLPLQSGSAATLRRMLRKTTPTSFAALAQTARAACPSIALTTDLIAGFPGETEEEFAESLAFVRQMDFAGGHVFPYSLRPGTPAARMKAQNPAHLKKARAAALRHALAESAAAYRQRFLGEEMPVLWEAASSLDSSGWQMEGLTGNYLRVRASAPSPRWNQIDWVKLSHLTEDGLAGEILGERDL